MDNARLRLGTVVTVVDISTVDVNLDGTVVRAVLLGGAEMMPGDTAICLMEDRRIVCVGAIYVRPPFGTEYVPIAEGNKSSFIDVYPYTSIADKYLFLQALGSRGVYAIANPYLDPDFFRVTIWYDDPAVADELRYFHWKAYDPATIGDFMPNAVGQASVPVTAGATNAHLDVNPGMTHQDKRVFLQALGGKGVYAIADQNLSPTTFRITVWYDNPPAQDENRLVNWLLVQA